MSDIQLRSSGREQQLIAFTILPQLCRFFMVSMDFDGDGGFVRRGVSRGGGAVQKACSLNDLLDSCLFMSCQSNQFHSAQLDSDLTWIASNCCCAAAKCKFLPNPKHMYVWTPVLKILANATFHFFPIQLEPSFCEIRLYRSYIKYKRF